MKLFTIVHIAVVNSHGLSSWKICSNNSDCNDEAGLICCDVTKEGQDPIKLCGNNSIVPLGSP